MIRTVAFRQLKWSDLYNLAHLQIIALFFYTTMVDDTIWRILSFIFN